MTDKSTESWEVARLCPRCGEAGEEGKQVKGPHGSMVHTLFCRNARCKWHDTAWLVQVNENGEVPVRPPGEKEFVKLNVEYGKGVIENLRRELEGGSANE